MKTRITIDNKTVDSLGLTYLPPDPSRYSSTVLIRYDYLKKEATRIWNKDAYSEDGENYNRQAGEVLDQSDRSRAIIDKHGTRQSYLRLRVHELAVDLRNCEEGEIDQIILDMEDVFSELHDTRENINYLRRSL